MVKMKNQLTGTTMYVDDSRVLEYQNMGHTIVREKQKVMPEKKIIEDIEKIPKARTSKRKKV